MTTLSLGLGLAMAVFFSQPRERQVSEEYALESQRITRVANQAVDAGKLGDAETHADQLAERGYIGAWEIRARIHTAREEHEQALKVIDEGLKLVPDYDVMWTQRGNTLSDLERWDESSESYGKARSVGGENPDVDFNEALMNLRRDRYDVALRLVQRVLKSPAPGGYTDRVRAMEAYCLAALSKTSELESLVASRPIQEQAGLWLEASSAYLELGRKELALDAAICVAKLGRESDEEALWYVREAENRRSKSASLWTLIVEGREENLPFITSYHVVAETKEQALDFVRRLEPSRVELMKLDDATKREPAQDVPLGVYQRLGRAFYDP